MVYSDDFSCMTCIFVVDDFGNDIDIYFEDCYNAAEDFRESDDYDYSADWSIDSTPPDGD